MSAASCRAAVAIATLTLAYAAATTAASVVHALRFRQIDVPSAGRLVVVTAQDGRGRPTVVHAPTFAAMRAGMRSITAASMYFAALVRVEGPNGAFDAAAEGVTSDYAQLAGIRLRSGRHLDQGDEALGAGTVIILGESAAARLFGAAEVALGRSVEIEGRSAEIVGIKVDDGGSLDADVRPDVLLATGQLRLLVGDASTATRAPYVVGRLTPRASLAGARSEILAHGRAWLDASAPALAPPEARGLGGQTLQVESLSTGFSGLDRQYGDAATGLMALTVALLGLGIVNIAGFMAVQAARREHASAVRLALGAKRWRLVATEFVNGVALSLAALAAAIPLAWWAIAELTTAVSFARGTPLARTLFPEGGLVAAFAAVALLVGVAAGCWPAWIASNLSVEGVLRRRAATSPWRATRLVAIVQVAASLALVTTAVLAAEEVESLIKQAPSLRGQLLWTRLAPSPGASLPVDETYLRHLTEQVARDVGGHGAALSALFPAFFGYVGQLPSQSYSLAGGGYTPAEALTEAVSPGFFAVVAVEQRIGRDFDWRDDLTRPAVAIVNEAMVSKLGAHDVVGRTLLMDPGALPLEIVGVVADSAIGSAREPHVPVVFRPMAQLPARARTPLLHVSVPAIDATIRERYVKSVESLGRHYVRALFSLDEWIRFALLRERLLTTLARVAGALALLLTGLGLHVLMTQFVLARHREFGVRAALGATPRHLAALVLRHSAVTMVIGIGIGVPMTLSLLRVLGGQLFAATRPSAALVATALTMAVAGTALVWPPTRRAADVDPAIALREE